MKTNTKKIGMLVLALLLMLIGAGITATTASAKAIGEDYTIMGFNAGWVLIGIGVALALLFGNKILKMPKAVGLKPMATFVALLLVIGFAMVFVQGPAATTGEITGLPNINFDIEASAVTTDGSYYPDTTYDEDSGLFTVPFKANTTGSNLSEHGDNSTYGDDPRMNFTIKAELNDDSDDDDLAIIYFEIVNPTLYVASDADNYVLTKTNDKHQATWTDQDGNTNTVSGWTSGGIEETFTVTLDLDLYEAGLVNAEVFDPVVMNIKFHNKANTWSETFQVQFVCTESYS